MGEAIKFLTDRNAEFKRCLSLHDRRLMRLNCWPGGVLDVSNLLFLDEIEKERPRARASAIKTARTISGCIEASRLARFSFAVLTPGNQSHQRL